MAKHHWSKKAVLASLMLGASVLVNIHVSAKENFELNPELTKQALDQELTELSYIAGNDDSAERTKKLIKTLEGLNTPTILELFDNLMHPTSRSYSENSALNSLENLMAPMSDQDDLRIRHFFGFKKGLGLHHITPENGGPNKIPFTLLLETEISRRLKSYEIALKDAVNFSSKGKEVQQNLEKVSEEKNKLNTDIEKKKEELEKLTEERKNLTTQLEEANKTNEALTTKVGNIETQAKKASEEAKALHEQVNETANQNQNLQSQLESKQKDLTDLQQRFDTATELNQEEKANLQAELDSKKAEVDQLQAKVTESQATLDKLTAEKAEAEAKVDSLTSEKAEIEAKLNSQTELSAEEKANLEKQLADIQSKIAEKDASIKSLEGQLDALKQQEHDTAPSTPETPQEPEVKPEDKPAEPQQPETKPQAPQAPEAGKPSTPKKPEIKPAPTPAIPEKPSTPHTPEKPGKAHPAAPKAHHAATPAVPHMAAQNTAAHLPQTGEAATNPFFTVAALSIIASAGILATKRKED
ncbi:LPXTG cell wall anchor domain-containing protein [Streptococcus halichoeri]|uniref:LPXTG cell wall anchor domain-containing protein n=1 Tax=Streptococcus halichoeri TaxID=254785 RepID=UPI001C8EF38D|nr:LPXTG cell wall anchor domain-containing protein [Streptococcus halichoeri]